MKNHHRMAFTIIEAASAAAVLGVVLGMVVPLVLLIQAHRREAAVHRQAQEVADNLLERALALDWRETQTTSPGESIAADELLASLPGGECQVGVVEEPGPVGAMRLTVTVMYASRGQLGTVRLTAWTYPKAASGSEL
jgi:hypothetical protein